MKLITSCLHLVNCKTMDSCRANGKDMCKKSQIAEFFRGKNVFVTGSTGFLGSVIVEKLLRCCPEINRIYLLIRGKKGLDVDERFQKLMSAKIEPDCIKRKVSFMNGDMTLPGLGLSEEDKTTLKNEVSVIFHSAATTNFGSHLRQAAAINLQGTEKVLQLSQEIKNLEVFVYISTAYCNAVVRGIITEDFYPSWIDSDELLDKLNKMTDDEITEKTKSLLGGYPTTYSFTKHMAESVLYKKRKHVPVAVIRPSVILGALEEPLPGWVENVQNGGVAFIAGAGKGIFRTVLGDNNKVADFVPCDMVASLTVAAAWDVARIGQGCFKIYHSASGLENPITLNDYCNLTIQKVRQFPCSELLWYPGAKCRINLFRNYIFVFLFHLLPGYLLTIWEKCNAKNRPIILYHKKFIRGMGLIHYFTTREWRFDTKNTRNLANKLSETDNTIFNFDVKRIDWPKYLERCVLGVRQFYHRDYPETIGKSRNLIKIMRVIHYGLYFVVFLFSYYLLHLSGLQFWTAFVGAAFIFAFIFWL